MSPALVDQSWPARFEVLAQRTRHPDLARFYGQGTVAPDCPLSEVPLVALDIETTGLDAERHGIVSLGLVHFDLERIRMATARHWLVKPRRDLASASVGLHGITHQAVAEAPDIEKVLPALLEALAGRVVVVHYRAIERRFLERASRERLGEPLIFPVIDTLALEGRWRGRSGAGWADRLARFFGLQSRVSLRLADCRERYHLPRYRAHHALVDALATAELLQAQLAWHHKPSDCISQLWS